MPRTTKDSHVRELDDDHDEGEPPQVDELEPDERVTSRLADDAPEAMDDEDLIEDIDLDDLAAMEGPDA
jgi:hypothetical protein